MKLYSYFRSSAAYRVRIALNLKNLSYEVIPVHLINNGGEQRSQAYTQLNPTQLVPTLSIGEAAIGQSLAILEYLEEQFPQVPLLPKDALLRAHVRSFAQHIACDIHPINNLRVLQYLSQDLQISDEQKQAWYAHWIHKGFTALETELAQRNTDFCFGDTPTIADCYLVPQVYNAQRFKLDLSAYPNILKVNHNCNQLPAFQLAAPEQQIDAI